MSLFHRFLIYGKHVLSRQASICYCLLFIFTVSTLLFTHADAAPPFAAERPAVRLYKGYWSGIHVVDLIVSMDDDEFYAYIESYGIAKTVSKYKSSTATRYQYRNQSYLPLEYTTAFEQRKGSRKVLLRYDINGDVISENVTPPDHAWKRPKVPDELKKNALDPLTTFMAARQKIMECLEKDINHFSTDVYDGRSLSRLDFTIEGHLQKTIYNKTYPVVKVTFKRRPIAGFTNTELKKMPKEEPVISVYFSDDQIFLPIKVDAKAPIGMAALFFEKECSSIDECRTR